MKGSVSTVSFHFQLWGACPSTFHEGFMAGARTVSVSTVSFHFELWGACPSTFHEGFMAGARTVSVSTVSFHEGFMARV